MIELFVEGSPADVNESFSSLLTYSIDDINDFSAKNTTFSKTIILPGTKRNNALFGNLFEVSAGNDYDPTVPNRGINFNAAISASTYIFCDNIQVFKGVLRMMEVVIDNGLIEYEIAVFGELGGFTASLGAKKITGNDNPLFDLDFSAYNDVYSVANIVASWDNLTGSGLYYPLINYGNATTDNHSWKYHTFRPALFVKEYWDKIFEMSGYTYDCALINTARFKSLIIPHGKKATQQLTNPFFSRTAILNNTNPYDDTPLYLVGEDNLEDDYTFNGPTTASGFTNTGENITYTATTPLEINISFNVRGTKTRFGGSNQTTFYFDIMKNNDVLETKSFTYSIRGEYPFSVSFNLYGVSVVQNDEIHIRVRKTSGSNTALKKVTSEINITSYTQAVTDIQLGDTLKVNNNLAQNILQKDFISSIVKLFNLYIFEDPLNDKVLKIKPFVDFYADATSEDWSLKLDRSQPIRIKPMSELNARYYEFKFKSDTDFYNEQYQKRYNQTYGSLIYDSEYEFAKETEKIEVIFSGTPLVGFQGEDKVYSTIYKKSGSGVNEIEESIDTNIRILQAKKITGVTSWDILSDAGAVLGSYTVYGYAGHFDDPDAPANDIQFGVPKELYFDLVTGGININQFNLYWGSYMAEITDKDSKLLTGTFKLNYKDIYNLDFSKFIYIDGNLFRLNKIIDFNATHEDTCKAELLKISNRAY
ncbi:MAG: hypothetical protein V4708_16370 [Bacteroidota bacterium]